MFRGAGKLAWSDESRLHLCPAVLSLEIMLRLGRDQFAHLRQPQVGREDALVMPRVGLAAPRVTLAPITEADRRAAVRTHDASVLWRHGLEIPRVIATDAPPVRAALAFRRGQLAPADRTAPVTVVVCIENLGQSQLLADVGGETGVAPADIDLAMTLGCSHPMGPLRLADLIGLDTVCSIAESLFAASGNAHDAPPALLLRMVADGELGDKSGGGFYSRGSATAAN